MGYSTSGRSANPLSLAGMIRKIESKHFIIGVAAGDSISYRVPE